MEQLSDEWFQARVGKVTASRIADVVAKTQKGYGASRANYMAELIAERLTGQKTEGFVNAAMQWGTEKEPDARAFYEFRRDVGVELIGFVDHPSIGMSGASPDGYVGDEGLVEFKCPNTATHIDTLLGAPIADKYIKQMQWQMACCERAWCDFVSFDPRMPVDKQIKIIRVERDKTLVDELETEVRKFLKELDGKLTMLEEMAA